MATNNKRISVAELDFDAIKTNLKNFLKGQEEFQDYDFEGSAMSVLIDLLAYNTHYNGIYTNLAVNEMFIDSASKRSSVVSLAKMLGYVPRSATCSRAKVTLTVSAPTSTPDVATLPGGQPFITSVNGKSYVFYNQESVTVSRTGASTYTFPNIEIVEGTPLQFKYTVADGVRYIIPNANVDLSTLKVQVQENSSSTVYETFVRADDLTSVTPLTKTYFIKEIDDGLYELTFGDDVLGVALANGNVVTLSYYVSSLEEPNFANVFTYNGASVLGSNLSVVTVDPASGGYPPEDIKSIKFNAPKMYAAQNRAVTPDDYKSIIYNKFPQAASVQVWGGEDNTPPVYGKTFICVKPKDANKLTNQQKELILTEILQNRNVVSITPEIQDPEFFNIRLNVHVHFNPKETTKSPLQIETIVKEAIMAYNDSELERFDSILRYSKLTKVIDEADPSIINNITTLMVHHPHSPAYGTAKKYVLVLINPISKGWSEDAPVFRSTGIYIPNSTQVHYLDDDGQGNIRLYYLNANFEKVMVNARQGVIDYDNGVVEVDDLHIVDIADNSFDWEIVPESYDVVSALNQIVRIDPTLLEVTAIADNTANGDTGAGYAYKFNSIRK